MLPPDEATWSAVAWASGSGARWADLDDEEEHDGSRPGLHRLEERARSAPPAPRRRAGDDKAEARAGRPEGGPPEKRSEAATLTCGLLEPIVGVKGGSPGRFPCVAHSARVRVVKKLLGKQVHATASREAHGKRQARPLSRLPRARASSCL